MLSILAFIGMPLSAVLTLISNDVIYVLLGPRWNEAGPILCAFGPSIGITMLYVTHGWLHLSLGTPGRWFRWSIVEFIATVFCLGLGLPFGSTGVATAFTASFYVLIGPALWYAGKPIDLKLSTVLLAVWKPSVAAVGAGVLCWIILNQTGALSNSVTNLSAVTRISAVVIIVIFVYLVLIVAMHRSMRPLSQFVIFMQELRRVRYQAK